MYISNTYTVYAIHIHIHIHTHAFTGHKMFIWSQISRMRMADFVEKEEGQMVNEAYKKEHIQHPIHCVPCRWEMKQFSPLLNIHVPNAHHTHTHIRTQKDLPNECLTAELLNSPYSFVYIRTLSLSFTPFPTIHISCTPFFLYRI